MNKVEKVGLTPVENFHVEIRYILWPFPVWRSRIIDSGFLLQDMLYPYVIGQENIEMKFLLGIFQFVWFVTYL